MAAEVRPLQPDDDRNALSCGDLVLDRFFHHYAGQNQFKLHLSTTYVAVVDEHILGFATVTPGVVERATLPSGRLRRRMPAYPLPVLRLARLGVDHRAQGSGIGKALVRHVLRLALELRDTLGCVAVVVDAKPTAVPFYERYGFVPIEGVREGALHGEPTALCLEIATVSAALEG